MKITIRHTDNKNKMVMSHCSIDRLLSRMTTDDSRRTVMRFREVAPYRDRKIHNYDDMPQWRHVYPGAELKRDDNDNMVMKCCNGIITLQFGDVTDRDAIEKVKRAVAFVPSTMAAFQGADGMSVVVLVRYAGTDGTLPSAEEEADRQYRIAHQRILPIYRAVVNVPLRGGEPSLFDSFLMTVDSEPYYNPDAVALRIDDSSGVQPISSPVSLGDIEDEPRADDNEEAQKEDNGVRVNIVRMMRLLRSRYDFRYNVVMKYVEYQSKEKPWYGYMPVEPRVQKRMTLEVQLADIRVSIKDVRNFLESDYIQNYDPISDFLQECNGKWDGKDHIRELARTVPTSNPHWEDWFYTWFLAMVSQWQGTTFRQYGNSVAPLLISRQGYNKSTFCRRLLPPELQWGYNDNLILSEKRQVYQAMSQFLLVNLDEFNQISPTVQQGFLKNLIQLPTLKIKRPYGSHVEEFPRLASFIATSNLTDILADPSGNRRFIGIELTGPIDVSVRPNYRQLYAQALAALRDGEKSYFDSEQVRLIMHSNCEFEVMSPTDQYFNIYYEIVDDENEGEWLTAAEIFDFLKKTVGSSLKVNSLMGFGRRLANMADIRRKRFASGMKYLVRKRT